MEGAGMLPFTCPERSELVVLLPLLLAVLGRLRVDDPPLRGPGNGDLLQPPLALHAPHLPVHDLPGLLLMYNIDNGWHAG